MEKLSIIIDGNKFSSLQTFYDEIENKLTKNLDFKIGRNLNAFNDVLYGGFGVFEYEDHIKLIWANSAKSQKYLGWDETIKHLSEQLKTCHSTNIDFVKTDLESAKKHNGETLFKIIVDIVKSHDHIELILA